VSPAGAEQPPGPRPVLAPRPKLTSRAAVLAVVLCAISLTLAYPVREYIADHRQIDQIAAQNTQIAAAVKRQRAELRALESPSRIEQEARDGLHMCFPTQKCYEVIYPTVPQPRSHALHVATPWYGRLWKSVEAADASTPR
jgi:cell division protein FtsL